MKFNMMKFFHRFNVDDFAEIAASPERRRAAIASLDRRARRLGVGVAVMMLTAVALMCSSNIGAVCWAMLAAMSYGVIVQLHCDSRSLQVLDLMQKEHEKPSS